MPRKRNFYISLFISAFSITIVILTVIAWTYHCTGIKKHEPFAKKKDFDVDYRRSIAASLIDIAKDIKGYERKIYPRTMLKINSIIEMLDPRYIDSNSVKIKPSSPKEKSIMEEQDSPDVCGEVFYSPRHQFPFYHKNNARTCKNGKIKKHISDLVTILINTMDETAENSVKRLDTILRSLREYNKNMSVLVAVKSKPSKVLEFESKYGYVTFVNTFRNKNANSGHVLNTLLRKVKTPYVLIARDLSHFHPFARLERQIYAISISDYVRIAGGAFRNETGHWKVGCFQTEIKNYKLHYVEGYKYSAYGCMFCDYLEGPFVARTDMMRYIQLNEMLPNDFVFVDWFLQIRHSNILTMSCPDAMYFTRGRESFYEKQNRLGWKSIAKDWDLNRIIVPPNLELEFTCKELDIPCSYLKWDSYFLLPPCCLAQLANAWEKLDTFTKLYDINYELQFGTILGAVKLRSQLPWDPDGDVFYDAKYYEKFLQMKSYSDVTFKQFDSTDEDGPMFKIFTPDYYIEMWGRNNFTTELLPKEYQQKPTLVNILGLWLKGVANPGLYARNNYGFEYLKHAQHPLTGEFNKTFNIYRAGKWNPCPSRHYHACLDRYPIDGSIDFVP